MNKLLVLLTLLVSFTASNVYAEEIKLASWNIAWLSSHGNNKRTESDYQALAKYAKQLDADVISLQEVENGEWAKKIFGDEYEYYFTTRDWVQRVGVAVRKSSGYTVDAIEYKPLDIGRVRNGMDVTLTKDGKKLRLLAVHLKSGCFDKALDSQSINGMSDKSKRDARAKRSCEKLSKQIEPLETWIDARATEGVPFVVLGDFNRRFSIDIEKAYAEEQGLWQAIDDEGPEDLWTPTLELNSKCWGGYYKDYIDHIVLDPMAKSKYIENSFEQIVFKGKCSRALSNALSDHCPIALKLGI